MAASLSFLIMATRFFVIALPRHGNLSNGLSSQNPGNDSLAVIFRLHFFRRFCAANFRSVFFQIEERDCERKDFRCRRGEPYSVHAE